MIGSNGYITNLNNAIKLEVIDGSKEIISLAYGKISDIPKLDVLIGRDFLQGEVLFLKNYANFLIDKNRLTNIIPIQLPLHNQDAICVGTSNCSGISFKDVIFTYPFPFRDSSFNSAIIFEVLDLDIIREVYRVVKSGSKVYMILRDKLFGGVDPLEGLRKLSSKFKVAMVKEKEGFWIIEGVKKR
ncbi:hypothetical protein [Saccharolobus solfataricus]|uniref:hypothetical protein n=1 Tax=Saccharolobus solfataricus TaxID=2287 RepID=UPI0004958C83|nr:hypothetical protein [Saccharolobus solfataricus]